MHNYFPNIIKNTIIILDQLQSSSINEIANILLNSKINNKILEEKRLVEKQKKVNLIKKEIKKKNLLHLERKYRIRMKVMV